MQTGGSGAFKADLIATPKAAIEAFTGKEMSFPENTKIIVEDQTSPDFIYINIPRAFDLNDIELTDEQLEVVAGGEWVIIAGIAIFGIGIYLGYNSK